MRKIILNPNNALGFIGMIKKMAANNESMVFPSRGVTGRTSKFGNLRKITSFNPMRLTTSKVEVSLTEKGVRILNPLNEGFGYSDLIIKFGLVVFAYDSFFWKDSWGFWRQMKFSKQLGWALTISGGRKENYLEIIPNETQSLILKIILLNRVRNGDVRPIKRIRTVSGNRKAIKEFFGYIPFEFEPEYQYNSEMKPLGAFSGSASSQSYRMDLETKKRTPGLLTENPKNCQAVVFIDGVVSFDLF